MRFDLTRLDGDETYAPCLLPGSGGRLYWRCPPAHVKAGYGVKNYRLPGKAGDGQDDIRAAKCRDLTRQLLRWLEGAEARRLPGTWGELIGRYKSHALSPIWDVEPNTRDGYLKNLAYWEPVLGHVKAEQTTYDLMRGILKGMEAKDRSPHFIHAKFTMLRIVAGYGAGVDPDRWRNPKTTLTELKGIRTPKARDIAPTRSQVMAIVEKADAAGESRFALGVLIQFFLGLRAMDVRGDWFNMRPGETAGIVRGKKRWGKGLTWDMIDRDVTTLTKVASKTERRNGRAMEFDLTLVPVIRERLTAIEHRVGPVIVDKHGLPYSGFLWALRWRTYRDLAGVPAEVKLMDVRAGAATEAEDAGASTREVQVMLNHANPQTTERYLRGRDKVRNEVIELRGRK